MEKWTGSDEQDSAFQDCILEALGQMDEDHALAVALHDIYGLPHSEIAETMGMTEDSTMRLVIGGRRVLKNLVFGEY